MVLLSFMSINITCAIWSDIGVYITHASLIHEVVEFDYLYIKVNHEAMCFVKMIWELDNSVEQLVSNLLCSHVMYCFLMFWCPNFEFWAFECQVWASRTILEIPKFGMSAWAGKVPLEREMLVPRTFADIDVRSSGRSRARAPCHILDSQLKHLKSCSSVKMK